MSGFPTRPNRAAFGPTYEEERPVQDAKREIGADIFNLSFWQLSGLGRVAPKAVLVCSVSGSAVTTEEQMLAFDPDDQLSKLTWSYGGVGDYSVAFQQQYPDEQGNDVNLALIGGVAVAMGATPRLGSVDLTSAYEADVYFATDAGAAVDPAGFVVFFW